MFHLYQDHDPEDFQARIRILTADEGGRARHVFNGIRWDFSYLSDEPNIYMIWPDFFDDNGNSLSRELPLPINQWLNARMYIVIPEMRAEHRLKIREGVKFHCMEGATRVAEGVVSKIVGLYENPSQ